MWATVFNQIYIGQSHKGCSLGDTPSLFQVQKKPSNTNTNYGHMKGLSIRMYQQLQNHLLARDPINARGRGARGNLADLTYSFDIFEHTRVISHSSAIFVNAPSTEPTISRII